MDGLAILCLVGFLLYLGMGFLIFAAPVRSSQFSADEGTQDE